MLTPSPAPAAATSFVLVHFPALRAWQGIYLTPALEGAAHKVIAAVRGAGGADPALGDPTTMPHLTPEDAALAVCLSGVLADYAVRGAGRPVPKGETGRVRLHDMAVVAWAMAHVAQRRFVLVTAGLGETGSGRTLATLDAEDVEGGRDVLLLAIEEPRATPNGRPLPC